MLYCNVFLEGGALLEREPQGDASVPVKLPGYEEALAELIGSPETSEALARLFFAGVTAGERAARESMYKAVGASGAGVTGGLRRKEIGMVGHLEAGPYSLARISSLYR